MKPKENINDLAVLGGIPAFSGKLHVGRPNIGDRRRLLERINDILDRKWLTNNGPCVIELEKRIAGTLGVRHCICLCNGTIALDIANKALGLKGEVIVPSFTFIATAHALQWRGITPVFCDIDPDTHNIDPGCIEQLITPRTTAIIGVHLWGRPCDIPALTEIAHRHNLRLLFDSAHAFGVSYKGHMIGSFGDAEVLSFHATKFLNTLEGGAIVTNNDELAQKIRLMGNFGFNGYDSVVSVGTNGKMDEMSAAMGLTLMDNLENIIEANRSNYELYSKELGSLPGIALLEYNKKEKCNYQYIVMNIDEKITGINRDQMVKLLHAENILARRYFYPGCHRMEPYRSDPLYKGLLLPVTEMLAERLICLPTGISVSEQDIRGVCGIIGYAVEHGQELARLLTEGGRQ